MLGILSFAFNVFVVVGGLLILGVMLLQVRLYRRQAENLAPRAARAWWWRNVSGMCAAGTWLCFGLWEVVGSNAATSWLPGLGIVATGGLLVAMVRLSVLDPQS